jgi:UMF1 family MFS transporter
MKPSADVPLPSDMTDGTFDLDGHSVDPVIAHPELPRHATFPAAASWVMYDASNTVYAVVVVTYYMTAYFGAADRLGAQTEWAITLIGAANFLSMIVAGLVVPVIGSMMDGKRGMPSLIFWTLACVGSTAMISVFASMGWWWAGVGAFACANFSYQISLVPYNTMLAVVAKPGREGLVSGLGVGFGYVGALGAVVGVTTLVGTSEPAATEATWAFAYAGLLFILFAAPCFFLVKEPGRPGVGKLTKKLVKDSFAGTMQLLREVRRDKMLLCFYAGNFLIVDALNTILFFFIPYMYGVYGMEVRAGLMDLPMFLSALYVAGLLCGTGIGWLGDRVNLKWLFCLMPLLLATAIVAGLLGANARTEADQTETITPAGATASFAFTVHEPAIVPGTLRVVSGALTVTDGKDGALVGDVATGTNKVTYATGAIDVTFAKPTAAPVTVSFRQVTNSNLFAMQLTVIVIGGCALAGIWTIGRKILVVIAPPEQLGRYFGLYGLTLKVSTVGSLTFGVLADVLSYRWALGSLLVYITLGALFLFGLPNKLERVKPQSSPGAQP